MRPSCRSNNIVSCKCIFFLTVGHLQVHRSHDIEGTEQNLVTFDPMSRSILFSLVNASTHNLNVATSNLAIF